MARSKFPSDGGLNRRDLGLPANWRTSQSIRYFLQKQVERCAAKQIEPHRLAAMTASAHVILQLFMSEHEQRNREDEDGKKVGELIDQPEIDVEPEGQPDFDSDGEFVDVETEEERELKEDARGRTSERYHTETGTIVAIKPRR